MSRSGSELRSARIVIVGGGIAGVSAAYHLAKLGVEDIVLLERARLSSGTTGHSTGNMETYRSDPLIFEMVRYAAECYPEIASESGRDIGWRVVGRVMYTDREERWEHMRALPALGRARGIEIDLLSPAALGTRLPIIAPEELIGGVWIPSDARVSPTDAVNAFAWAARSRGVAIHEHCAILGIARQNDRVSAVVTADGDIPCDSIVLAAGLWSRDIAKSCAVSLPLYALEHQYLITRPFGVDRNLPLFLSYDDQLYGREEVGGIIVGSLDDHAIPITTGELPQDPGSCLLAERWEQFEPYMTTAMRRFPVLRTAHMKMLLNGPESFTPDGQMLLGPVPGISGLYALCGFNSNGMALAPAAGRYIAEWIVEGAPSSDVAPLDVRRFSTVQSTEEYLRARVTEIPGYACRMHSPIDDYQTARDVRRSPLHAELVARGAKFSSVNGWERALWFDRKSRAGDSHDEARAPRWLDAVAQEAAGALNGALLIDRSSDAKFLLAGTGARAWLKERAPGPPDEGESQVRLALLPALHGGVEVLTRVLESRNDQCWLTTTPDQETRLVEWLRINLPAHLRATDRGSELACLELRGPRAGALLRQALGARSAREARTGAPGDASIEAREDLLQGSTVILVPVESAVSLWRWLVALGEHYDLEVGGYLAEEALRIERGIPAFGREMSPATRTRRGLGIAAFTSPLPQMGFGRHELILDQRRVVGEITSRVRLPGWQATLALGRLDGARWHGQPIETVVDGLTWPLELRASAWRAATERSAE